MSSRARTPACLIMARFAFGSARRCCAVGATSRKNIAIAAVRIGGSIDRPITLKVKGQLVVSSATSVKVLLTTIVVLVVRITVAILYPLYNRLVTRLRVASAALRIVVNIHVSPLSLGTPRAIDEGVRLATAVTPWTPCASATAAEGACRVRTRYLDRSDQEEGRRCFENIPIVDLDGIHDKTTLCTCCGEMQPHDLATLHLGLGPKNHRGHVAGTWICRCDRPSSLKKRHEGWRGARIRELHCLYIGILRPYGANQSTAVELLPPPRNRVPIRRRPAAADNLTRRVAGDLQRYPRATLSLAYDIEAVVSVYIAGRVEGTVQCTIYLGPIWSIFSRPPILYIEHPI